MHQPVHEYFAQAIRNTTHKWFIVLPKYGKEYYLRDVTDLEIAEWTTCKAKAIQFESDEEAEAFVLNFLNTRNCMTVRLHLPKEEAPRRMLYPY